jgi:capsid protein
MIDEKKEIDAAKLRIDTCLSTHAAETALLGGDWERNVPQLRKEIQQLAEAGITWPASAPAAPPAAAASADAAEDGADTTDQQAQGDMGT